MTRYEKELLAYLHSSKGDLLAKIRSEKALTDDIQEQIEAALTEFTKNFG